MIRIGKLRHAGFCYRRRRFETANNSPHLFPPPNQNGTKPPPKPKTNATPQWNEKEADSHNGMNWDSIHHISNMNRWKPTEDGNGEMSSSNSDYSSISFMSVQMLFYSLFDLFPSYALNCEWLEHWGWNYTQFRLCLFCRMSYDCEGRTRKRLVPKKNGIGIFAELFFFG